MQRLHYTDGLKKIPDRTYTDKEIRMFYEKDLNAEIARDRKIHNTPPGPYDWEDALLEPVRFAPEIFLFEHEETGELFHPQTPEIAHRYLKQIRQQERDRFEARPPFDPTETIACFRDCYRSMLRYGATRFPQWVQDTVDKRLLALNRIPESAYKQLKKEERANRREFERIEKEAAVVLHSQDIPQALRSAFCFHDASVLAIKKERSDVELYLNKGGDWSKDATPYSKVVFQRVRQYEREKGFSLRTRLDANGTLCTGCTYLYEELYRDRDGYEVHMLFWTPKALRDLIIRCEDICLEDNIAMEAVPGREQR